MLLSVAELGVNRTHRILLVIAGLLVYALFCASLLADGQLKMTASAFALLLGVWAAGFVALLFADEHHGRFDAGTLTFSIALWCNLGVVITAALVPSLMRLLLLVVPLFGVLYASLHLSRAQMLTVAVITWVGYLVSSWGLVLIAWSDPSFEARLSVAFTCMLLAMAYMASEVTALRDAFARRRQRLNEAMQQLAELAMRDELTGLYNRRYIMDVLGRQKALADRGHLSFTLCYCDLDHFKRINDRYGHQAGDRVLRDFAEVANSVVRSVDFVARRWRRGVSPGAGRRGRRNGGEGRRAPLRAHAVPRDGPGRSGLPADGIRRPGCISAGRTGRRCDPARRSGTLFG